MYMIFDEKAQESVTQMEKFVREHENGHFLQMPRWAKVKECWDWRGILSYRRMEESWTKPAAAENNALEIKETGSDGVKITGALSVLIRRLPLGVSVLYAPRGFVCDRSSRQVLEELFWGVEKIAEDFHGILFLTDADEPDSNHTFRKVMQELGFLEKNSDGFGALQPQHVFRLKLSGRSREEIYASFYRKTRYNIRLALRHQVKIRQFDGAEGIPEYALTAFSELMETTGRRDGFLVRGREYFEKIFSTLGKEAILFLAYLEQEPIAVAICICNGKKAWYLYGASANEHRNAMPNYLLQWEMIQYALRQGCGMYDFRGVPGNVQKEHPLYGLYRFKKGFAGDYVSFSGLFLYQFSPFFSKLYFLLYKGYRFLCRKKRKRNTSKN